MSLSQNILSEGKTLATPSVATVHEITETGRPARAAIGRVFAIRKRSRAAALPEIMTAATHNGGTCESRHRALANTWRAGTAVGNRTVEYDAWKHTMRGYGRDRLEN